MDELVPVVRTEYKLLAGLRTEHPEWTVKELASRLGYSGGAIRTWLKSPEYQRFENWLLKKTWEAMPALVRESHEQVQERFADFAGYMQERLLDIIDTSEDPKLQAQVAQDWLDRAGHAPV
mgnify:CR=1 FL=1